MARSYDKLYKLLKLDMEYLDNELENFELKHYILPNGIPDIKKITEDDLGIKEMSIIFGCSSIRAQFTRIQKYHETGEIITLIDVDRMFRQAPGSMKEKIRRTLGGEGFKDIVKEIDLDRIELDADDKDVQN